MSVAGRTIGALRMVFSGVWDLVLPGICMACGRHAPAAAGLCDQCNLRLLNLVGLAYCPRCGTTLGPNIPPREDGCRACGHLLPRFAQAVRLGPYAPPLRRLVQRLKYHNRDAMARRLGDMLADAVMMRCADVDFDVAVPVPMYWRRRVARGYNHAAVLARFAGHRLGLPVHNELRRVRNTPPQVNLPRTRRIENVKGAFEVSSARAVRGARVLLIDDVTTTGATANEAARTLLSAGASSVHLGVVAKAEPPRAYTRHLQTHAT